MNSNRSKVTVAPLQKDNILSGFVIGGRWPDSTLEWMQMLLIAVRVTAIPDLLPTATVFSIREDVPDGDVENPVGIVFHESTVLESLSPDSMLRFEEQPAGLMILRPSIETVPVLPEVENVASGCVFLPGLPHLGLEHRGGWIQSDREGNVTKMIAQSGIDPYTDEDTAILAEVLSL